MDKCRAWSIRIGHEAQLWDANWFVTLDYAPEHLRSWSLLYEDFQGFMKRLRRRADGCSAAPDGSRPIRFFVAGEYGARFRRPHWHAILFNLALPDAEEMSDGKFGSAFVESCWGFGNSVLGGVTPQSAAYVAGYTQSKSYGRAAEAAYEDLVDVTTGEVMRRRPEFCVMSRRPGIGAWWYDRFRNDLFGGVHSLDPRLPDGPRDHAVQAGKTFKVPRYYYERLRRTDPGLAEEVAYGRYLRAKLVDPEESTPERRAVREEVAESRVNLFSEREH